MLCPAPQAVALDLSSSASWYVLGNAYVSQYFNCTLDISDIKVPPPPSLAAPRFPHFSPR